LHPLGKRLNCAERPDLPWLRELIERHVGAQTSMKALPLWPTIRRRQPPSPLLIPLPRNGELAFAAS
jgi:hypothetical protein